jgi:hypothetical protein
MNKKLISALIATTTLLSILAVSPSKANTPPTLAIIDSAVNSSLPAFQGSIIQEVCTIAGDLVRMPWTDAKMKSCPNGTNFMEGSGSANMPIEYMMKNGFEHGNQMVSAALQTNPNLKIVFIRIAGHGWPTPGGKTPVNQFDVAKAYDWIIANKDKFNIQAVAMSQGLNPNTEGPQETYCAPAPLLTPRINSLLESGIPSFLPVGNQRNVNRIGWPSCLPNVISVAGLDAIGEIAIQNNWDSAKTIFVAKGSFKALMPNGTTVNSLGSSAANQSAAAQFIQIKSIKPSFSYQQLYDLMKNTAIIKSSPYVKNGYVINVSAATR